jgi:hypothetical protein
MNDFLPRLVRRSPIYSWLPLGYLVTVLLVDWLLPTGIISPPLLSVGILFFSTFLPPRIMGGYTPLYVFSIAVILINPKVYSLMSHGLETTDLVSREFRVVGFAFTCLFACYLSYLIQRLRNNQHSMVNIIKSLPLPVIISDLEGRITLLNEKAMTSLKMSDETASSMLNYFELLAPKSHRGKCIAEYISMFRSGTSVKKTIQLELKDTPITGSIQLLEGKKPKLITMLSEQQ